MGHRDAGRRDVQRVPGRYLDPGRHHHGARAWPDLAWPDIAWRGLPWTDRAGRGERRPRLGSRPGPHRPDHLAGPVRPARARPPVPGRGHEQDEPGERREDRRHDREAATAHVHGPHPDRGRPIRGQHGPIEVACDEGRPCRRDACLRIHAHEPDALEEHRIGGPGRDGRRQPVDGGPLGRQLGRGSRRATGALEDCAQGRRELDADPVRGRLQRGTRSEDGPRPGDLLLRLVELPVVERDPDRLRQGPVAGLLDEGAIGRPDRLAPIEERLVLRPDDPGAPQFGQVLAGPRLDEVEQGPPIGHAGPGGVGFGRGRPRPGPARLVGHLAGLDRLPDGGESVGADAVGDELGEVQGRRHPVRVHDRVGRALGGPRVERDAPLEERLGERECRHLDLERGRGPTGVVRGEPLGHPAIGDESAVEPGVGGLVEHDRRRGVIGDLDARGAAVEQGGVPARGPRDCLLHGEWRAVRALRPGGTPMSVPSAGRALRSSAAVREPNAASSCHDRTTTEYLAPPAVTLTGVDR